MANKARISANHWLMSRGDLVRVGVPTLTNSAIVTPEYALITGFDDDKAIAHILFPNGQIVAVSCSKMVWICHTDAASTTGALDGVK